MKVFILTEGGRKIGFGHITRCQALAQGFAEKGIAPVLWINGDNRVKRILGSEKFQLVNWLDKKWWKELQGADIVIVDSYLAKPVLYRTISRSVDVPVYLDDNKRLIYPEGIVVNGTIHAEHFDYLRRKENTFLLGSAYVPLRKAFWEVPKKSIRKNLKKVLITFGGNDPAKLTPALLEALSRKYPQLIKYVIIGPGFNILRESAQKKHSRMSLVYNPSAEKMKRLMLDVDAAFSAAGQTLYELARVGVPTIAVAVAANQFNNAREWEKAGFLRYGGKAGEKNTTAKATRFLGSFAAQKTRRRASQKGEQAVDGSGARRVVRACLRAYAVKNIHLREAAAKDLKAIYALSNERAIRKVSFAPSAIPFVSHRGWFRNKLKSPDSLLLIAEAKNDFVGQVRFEIQGEAAIVSLSLGAAYRGIGLGLPMLQQAFASLRSRRPQTRLVKAYVKEANTVSAQFFRKAGFAVGRKLLIKRQKAREFIYRIKQ